MRKSCVFLLASLAGIRPLIESQSLGFCNALWVIRVILRVDIFIVY